MKKTKERSDLQEAVLSFAEKNRPLASELANKIKDRGIKTYYDEFEQTKDAG